MNKELLEGLTEEHIAKIRACKDQKEILKVAKKKGIELGDEQLEAVRGGCGKTEIPPRPNCGSTKVLIGGMEKTTRYTWANCRTLILEKPARATPRSIF